MFFHIDSFRDIYYSRVLYLNSFHYFFSFLAYYSTIISIYMCNLIWFHDILRFKVIWLYLIVRIILFIFLQPHHWFRRFWNEYICDIVPKFIHP